MLRFLSVAFLMSVAFAMAENIQHNLMPVPASAEWREGAFVFNDSFHVAIRGVVDPRLSGGVARAVQRLERRTGISFAKNSTGEKYALIIECAAAAAEIPRLDEDESYSLEISAEKIVLRAPTTRGTLHGLETLLQLVESSGKGWVASCVRIADRPRFSWRGLMIDVCRHWQPMEVIKRNIDGMALVKLDVLHLHLTDDQGFRVESKKFPRLHELGSDGKYFSQEEIHEIVGYAAARGIRVVPEFDIPGHATSWVVAYPELASAPGPYAIERKWGVFDPVLDPTNPKVYELLEGFLGEMAALFPDAYLHIGGDENNGKQWSANAQIQAFIREHGLKDNAGLHTYFNSKVHAILAKNGKKMIGWDEILHPDLPAGSVIHSWRGADGVAAATKLGFTVLLSHGYYIDLCFPTAPHYLNDPAPVDAKLSDAQRKLVLGGEATMWAEWVSPETIDSRIWPRTAAIAERLWSPATVREVPEMYRRLPAVSALLSEAGLRHESYIAPALKRLAGDRASETDLNALRQLVDLLEPVKAYTRSKYQPGHTQLLPLTGLVDCCRPDSASSREFSGLVDNLLSSSPSSDADQRIKEALTAWRAVSALLLKRLPELSPNLSEAESMLHDLADVSAAGLMACERLQQGGTLTPNEARSALDAVQRAGKPRSAVELPATKALERLINAAIVGVPRYEPAH